MASAEMNVEEAGEVVNVDEGAVEQETTEQNEVGPYHSSEEEPNDNTEAAAAPEQSTTAAPWDPLATVDSALLSALCDQRERKALFRLERALLDFMSSPSSHIEVGGAYNSIVLQNGEGIDTPALSADVMQEIAMQQQKGIRQTSFQRLILHRCADRFGIVREVIPQNENVITHLNLIRLLKTEESTVPTHLLADVNLELLVDYKNPLARGGSGGVPYQDDVRNLSDSMNSSNLNDAKKTKKKMVIMKRNSSGGGADDKNKGKKNEQSRKGRKLVDREKAYEEARARIFGVEADAQGAATEEGSNNDDNTSGAMDGGAAEKKVQLNPQVAEFSPSSCQSQSPAVSENAESSGENAESKSEQVDAQTEAPADVPETETKPKQQRTKMQSKQSAQKAVYRNRQQEEADPDFKRRSDIRPAYIPAHSQPYPNNPYAPNPYVNMVNAAMGQHPQHVQHMHPMAMQHYYNQYYPNHMASPQSPAYFVGNGYPQQQQGVHGVPPGPQHQNNGVNGSRNASDSSLDNSNIQQPRSSRDSPNNASPEASRAQGCNTSPREGAVPAYTTEEFPALT